ncbi:MAG: formate dehydrogenase accessory sulfurtransferase FdhD [Bacteroidales bacterium]|nr:formate dehydrogenase accessory sulfurtransferase FdhD [Bacteroidales bacterium]
MDNSQISNHPALLFENGVPREIADIVSREDEIVLYLNGKESRHIIASNDMLSELGAGFFAASGIAKKILSVHADGKNVFVEAEVSSEENDSISSSLKISPEDVIALRESMNVDVWKKTGGLHCAALWHNGKIVSVSSDIARHNALDKVIGFMILHGLNPADCAVACTGRQPEGMVIKAAMAGIPIVVGRTAVTYRGITCAEKQGITLVGFARDKRFTIYTHPERIAGFSGSTSAIPEISGNSVQITGWKYADGGFLPVMDTVVVEEDIILYLNGCEYLKNVATQDSLKELGIGFFVAAGISKHPKSVRVSSRDIFVEADDAECIDCSLGSSGGFTPRKTPGSVTSDLRISPAEIFAIREQINTEEWDNTGALHCAVLYHGGRVVYSASDIGRHNAVDKVIGHMVLNNLPPAECVMGCTGRMPADMVSKAVNAGIPIIVSRAAATSAGISLAEKSGLTLICFTRPPRFTVYTHPERILTESEPRCRK